MSPASSIGWYVGLAIVSSGAIAYVARALGRRAAASLPLTRVTHLVPDASGSWMHVFGARRLMPEHGDSSDLWCHMMVEPRTGRWVHGASAPGADLDLDSPFVDRSMAVLATALGFEPRMQKGQRLALVVHEADSDAETVADRRRRVAEDGVVVRVGAQRDARATQICTLSLYRAAAVVGTHSVDAIAGAGFVARALVDAHVALVSYVGFAYTEPQARVVASDVDHGTVLFDVPCCYRSSTAS